MISIHHIFRYIPVSLKKDRTSSILTFLNRSIKLFTLRNRFPMRARALHSLRMCLTVQGDLYVKHCCCSCFSLKEWALYDQCAIGLLWLVLILIFRGFISILPKWAGSESLLWMLIFQRCCHFALRSLLILGFRSVYGILKLLGVRSKADFATASALSFPLNLMWLGIQHIIISLQLDIESS